MRHLLIALCGCVPLFSLTLVNVVRSLEKAAPSDTRKLAVPVDEKAINDLVAKVQQDVKAIDWLDPIDPFVARRVADSMPDKAEGVERALKKYDQVKIAVGNLAAIYRAKVTEDEEFSELDKFWKGDPFKGIVGGDGVERWCTARKKTVKNTMDKEERLKSIRKKMTLGDYESVKDEVTTLEGMRELSLSESERSEIGKYKSKSKFQIYRKTWPTAGKPVEGQAAEARLAELDKLFKDPNAPSPTDDADREFLAQRNNERRELQRNLRLYNILKKPPEQVIDLAEQFSQIVQEDSGAQPRLMDALKKWIQKRLQKKTAKGEELEQETWSADGKYRRGGFLKSKTPNKFLYFSDPKAAQRYLDPKVGERDKPSWDKEFFLDELKGEPQPLLEKRQCEAYNKQLDQLQKKLHEKREWQKFAEACEKIQNELTEYYDKMSTDKRDISVEDEAKLAREILEQWPKLSEILSSDRP